MACTSPGSGATSVSHDFHLERALGGGQDEWSRALVGRHELAARVERSDQPVKLAAEYRDHVEGLGLAAVRVSSSSRCSPVSIFHTPHLIDAVGLAGSRSRPLRRPPRDPRRAARHRGRRRAAWSSGPAGPRLAGGDVARAICEQVVPLLVQISERWGRSRRTWPSGLRRVELRVVAEAEGRQVGDAEGAGAQVLPTPGVKHSSGRSTSRHRRDSTSDHRCSCRPPPA